MLAPFELPLATLAARIAEAFLEPLCLERTRYAISVEQHMRHGMCQFCEPHYWTMIDETPDST